MLDFSRNGMARQVRRLRRAVLPRLFDLRLDLRRTNRIYHPLIAAARGQKKEQIIAEYFAERDLIDEEIGEVFTQRLLRRAQRLDVPIPDLPHHSDTFEDENWKRGHATGVWLLKTVGKQSLRKQIRDERKSRFEERTRWLPLIIGIGGMLIGLASALTSLILSLKK